MALCSETEQPPDLACLAQTLMHSVNQQGVGDGRCRVPATCLSSRQSVVRAAVGGVEGAACPASPAPRRLQL